VEPIASTRHELFVIRPVVLGVVLLLAACSANPVPSTPSPAGGAQNPGRTLDPDSPYQTTAEEYALQLKACLVDKGIAVDIDPYDQHLMFKLGTDASEVDLHSAVTACRAGLDPSRNEPPPPLSEDQLRALYHYRVAQGQCMTDAGYPTQSAPPEQVFVDAGGQWDPRMGPTEPLDIPQSVTRACEQIEGRPNFLDW
jgi:hypothetical protein